MSCTEYKGTPITKNKVNILFNIMRSAVILYRKTLLIIWTRSNVWQKAKLVMGFWIICFVHISLLGCNAVWTCR
jgi:hypothetical protein